MRNVKKFFRCAVVTGLLIVTVFCSTIPVSAGRYNDYRAEKQREWNRYQKEKQRTYRQNRNKSYNQRRRAYNNTYKRHSYNNSRIYRKYH